MNKVKAKKTYKLKHNNQIAVVEGKEYLVVKKYEAGFKIIDEQNEEHFFYNDTPYF